MIKLVCILLFIFYIPVIAKTQENENYISLFDSSDCIYLNLTFNFDSLFAGNYSEKIKYPAILEFSTNKTPARILPISLSKRGNFRKHTENCNFPALRLHFNSQKVKGTLFEGINKIKLVTHCQNQDTLFNQYILQEYYIYRIYNLLTERSMKVRLARCNYTDRKKIHTAIQRWGIILENPKDMAYRINGVVMDIKYITPQATDSYYYELMRLFQNMIINSDWSIGILHNIELVGIYPDLLPVTIPFDFDMAGLIHIPYNSPSVAFKKEEKPVRNLPIPFLPDKRMKQALTRINSKKTEILDLYKKDTFLADSIRNRVIESINEFYNEIEPKRLIDH